MTEKLYNVAELATLLQCSLNTAYATLRANHIKHARVGNRFRITESAIVEFLRGGDGGGTTSRTEQRKAA